MPDLIAQGAEPQHRWRRSIVEGRKYVLGRTAGAFATPWDDRISRQHIELQWRGAHLHVEKIPEARNPVFVGGRQKDVFDLTPGDHFVIGATTFTLTAERVNMTQDAPQPMTEQSYSPQYLNKIRYRNADQRIPALQSLQEAVLGAENDTELFVRLINVLLAGIPRATAVALVMAPVDAEETVVLHWDRRLVSGKDFRPSERLIRRAVGTGESVVHVWAGAGSPNAAAFTMSEDADWAFATPVLGAACRGWAIYVSGSFLRDSVTSSDPNDLRDDLKFTELAANTLANLREQRQLERRNSSLRQFLSPVVLEALAGQDPDVVLSPREADVSVLFCDLRGFSRKSESSGSGQLLELLNRVSQALGVMTHHILEQGGVVGDFHGDAAMGFWGWPLAQEDSIQRACRAALGIRSEFEAAAQESENPLSDFRMGIGIATGRAVAGKIGTIDQVKVTVFGPVVNLASRLEGMTKQFRAPILLDEVTAQAMRQRATPDGPRVRRVAVVQPYGLSTALEVSELLPPADVYPQLSDDHIAAYESALDALLARDWAQAFSLLHRVPADDRVKDFLTVFIAQHNRTAPDDWNGVIPLMSK
ncbi:MAG: adenylate/guanylate cyclase domain-containing protein [Pirellulaceae bacterium]